MYNSYSSDYTTYDKVNLQLKGLVSGADLTSDIEAVKRSIHDASSLVRGWLYRTFVPYINATAKAKYNLSPFNVQELPDDTLSVTSILDASGTTVLSSTYRLIDIHNNISGYPYRWVEFGTSSNLSYSDPDGFHPTLTIDGIFGYSDKSYADSWLDTTTLNGAIADATTTSVTVTDASDIETLSYIRIDSEFMQVQSISTNTLTVTRGVNGSTAIAHDDSTQVDVWQVPEGISLGCTRLASYLYMSRKSESSTVTFQDGTVAGINYPSIVKGSLSHYRKPRFESVR